MAKNILEIKNLTFSFHTYGGVVKSVRDVSFNVREGEILGIVGESGCGKSVTSQCILKLNPEPPGFFEGGSIKYKGEEIITKTDREMRKIRGVEIGFIFQDPMTSLNPTMTVGKQIEEVFVGRKGMTRAEVRERALEILRLVGINEPERRYKQYPHELSGGMKQRLGIAQAELNAPDILILDEPTAGLDPKERVRFRNLISDFAKEKIVILSTHIVSDVSYIADTILMMKDGTFLLQEPMATVTDSINGKVWELLVSDREAAEYSNRFSVVNLHHENGKVRLRMIHDTAPTADAITVPPSLEDLFLYHFGEEAGEERGE